MDPNNLQSLGQLGQPISKLIDTIRRGAGVLFHPRITRRNARAEAEAMLLKAQTISEIRQLLPGSEIAYEGEGLTISMEGAPLHNEITQTTLWQQAQARRLYQDLIEEDNIQQITAVASEELEKEQVISDDPVDPDWIKGFFNIAKDISKEDMQKLWGRLLAGEVKRPNSYSLRTLDLIKNLSKYDAELIAKAANLTLTIGDNSYLFIDDIALGNYLHQLGLKVQEQLTLQELGILNAAPLQLPLSQLSSPVPFLYGDLCILVFTTGLMGIRFTCFKFTRIGHEISSLSEIKPNMTYLKDFVKSLSKPDVQVKFGKYRKLDNGNISPYDLTDMPPYADSNAVGKVIEV